MYCQLTEIDTITVVQLAKCAHQSWSGPTSSLVWARTGWQTPATVPSAARMAPSPPTDFSSWAPLWQPGRHVKPQARRQNCQGAWACDPNTVRETHARVDAIMFLGTPPRCYTASPHRTPPAIRQLNFIPPREARRRPQAVARRRRLMWSSAAPRRVLRAARRGISSVPKGPQPRLTMMMVTAMTGRQAALAGAHHDCHTQWWASGETAYRPLQKTPRGGLPKPRVPHQAQAQGLQQDEEFHDLGVTHPGCGTQWRSG
jgi:hypothetical protein